MARVPLVFAICISLHFLALRDTAAENIAQTQGKTITVPRSVITPIQRAQVPSLDAGVISKISVKDGATVEKGSLLAQLNDQQAHNDLRTAQAELLVARAQSNDRARLDAQKAEALITESEYLQGSDLLTKSKNARHEISMRRLLLAPTRAEKKIESLDQEQLLTELNVKIVESRLEAARLRLERRQMKAPIGGIVAQRFRHQGEWVQPGESVFQIVRMDRLLVEGLIPAATATPQELLGKEVTISVTFPRGEIKQVLSTITFASEVIDSSNRFRVAAEIENSRQANHWTFRPGLQAEMKITVEAADSTSR